MTAASDPVAAALTEASTRFAIPRDWIAAVMQAESGGNANAVSAKGALGLMQLMPQTWQQLRAGLQLGGNAFDPHDNILAGTAYLKLMLDRYGTSGFLAAYNAGPGRYDDHLATGKPLPEETRTYMTRLAAALHLPQPGSAESLALDPRLVLFVGAASGNTSTAQLSNATSGNFTSAHQSFALAPQAHGLFVGGSSAATAP
ncbi:MAG TPA: lytic transglycosylase domain-containing protein [Rhizomicrobium sp.]